MPSVPSVPSVSTAVDINSADASQLASLPGIGPSKSQAIIDYRTKNGPFQSAADLEKVPGIGPKTMEKLTPLIMVKPGMPSVPTVPSVPGMKH
jgi:competence protein ComEA